MRHAPAPANYRADQHCQTNRETNQVPDREQQERQREIITAHGALASDSKGLRNVRGKDLRGHDDRKDG